MRPCVRGCSIIAFLSATTLFAPSSTAQADPNGFSVGYATSGESNAPVNPGFSASGGSWEDYVDQAASGELADLIASMGPADLQTAQASETRGTTPDGPIHSGQVAQADADGRKLKIRICFL